LPPLPGPDLALLQQPSNPIGLDNVLLGGVGAGPVRNLGPAAPNLVQASILF
ncbi:hypothetical protein MTO96_040203, partial [Rhipicephalus appendiculatus]